MQRFSALGLACTVVVSTAGGTAIAQTVPPVRSTVDLVVGHSNLDSGLPDGRSVGVRGVWLRDGGDVVYAEALEERKFGRGGGIVAGAYTRVFSPDWYGTGTVAAGHGGPNWADWRGDVQVSRKWLARRQLVTSAAVYYARFNDDGSAVFERRVEDTTGPVSVRSDRSDRGVRLSAAWYLEAPVVLEAGITFNRSEPGSVDSRMPYVAATYGRPGWQYVSLRVASGSEAYQALGGSAQLVDFHSDSAALTWRRWLGPRWGFTAQAEIYRNPNYRRETVAVGLFAQWR